QFRQRREPRRGVHAVQGRLRLRRVSGHRRAVRAAGGRARPPETGGTAAPGPAAYRRPGGVCADHGPTCPGWGGPPPRPASPDGQVTWGVHISLAPTWFDPAETPGMITPYMVLYALHDAMVKPMPGQPMAPSLAESWSATEDGLTYEFVLRKGAKFHNGDDVT